ncbi:MAG TPA: molybdate ABC transporter substrate-binding protein [Bacillota bacterium]|nr:molybdate ABC transporter substrate-binding protein [Bacillota bacterium]
MLKRLGIVLLCFLMLIPLACSSKEQPTSQSSNNQSNKVELMISAAASLKDAMNEMKTAFEGEHPNVNLSFNFGSSGKLAQQIAQGAPADIFLSASKKDMDTLEGKSLIIKDTRVDFTKNELVLIANKNSELTISSFENMDLSKFNHLAIGEPKSVPAGNYAEETFQNLKLWDQLQNKLVMGSDVRQVLTYVESGNTELGVVYLSDALISNKVKVLATAKSEWHKPIVYPGAIVANSAHIEDAKAFISYLSSDQGKELLKKYGFK